MQEAVKVIMNKYNLLKKEANKRREDKLHAIDLEYNQAQEEIKSLLKAAKSLCLHEEEREELFTDYHKGGVRVFIYCAICGKYLRSE